MPVLYASSPRRAAGQVTGDLLLLVWIAVCFGVARFLRDAILNLADAGRNLSEKSGSLSHALDVAAGKVSQLPMVGDDVASPFRDASAAVADMRQSGIHQADSVSQLAWWTFAAVFGLPVVGALLAWAPRRYAFIREASAAQRFIDGDPDVELFALRAMAHQPMHRLAKVSPDPLGAFRDRDPEVMRELARLELADAGLRLPRRSAR